MTLGWIRYGAHRTGEGEPGKPRRPPSLRSLPYAACVLAGVALLALSPASLAVDRTATPAGFAVLLAIFVGAGLTLLPTTPLVVGTIAVFGPVQGALAAGIGFLLSALTCYAAGRALHSMTDRSGWLHRRLVGRSLASALRRSGFTTVAWAHLSFMVPFGLVSYAAGIARVRVRDLAGGTVVGVAPTLLLLAVSSGAFHPDAPAAHTPALTSTREADDHAAWSIRAFPGERSMPLRRAESAGTGDVGLLAKRYRHPEALRHSGKPVHNRAG